MKFDFPFRSLSDVERFEGEKTFEERCPWRSVYDVFSYAADRFGDAPALSVIETGEPDEAPRDVSYRKLLEGITRAANFFRKIAGAGAGIGIMLPHLPGDAFCSVGSGDRRICPADQFFAADRSYRRPSSRR